VGADEEAFGGTGGRLTSSPILVHPDLTLQDLKCGKNVLNFLHIFYNAYNV
jgi:hypothetical protein